MDKVIYYALVPEQKRGASRYLLNREVGMSISLADIFGEKKQQLKHYEADAPHKILGVCTDPACVNREQVTYMANHSKDWNYRMLGSSLPPSLKLLSFKAELLPKLKYPLPASPLRECDLEAIIQPALVSLKHSLGLPKTTESEIIFFPRQY